MWVKLIVYYSAEQPIEGSSITKMYVKLQSDWETEWEGKAERGEKTVCNIKTMCVTRLHRAKRNWDIRIAIKVSPKCYKTYVFKTLYSFRDTAASMLQWDVSLSTTARYHPHSTAEVRRAVTTVCVMAGGSFSGSISTKISRKSRYRLAANLSSSS